MLRFLLRFADFPTHDWHDAIALSNPGKARRGRNIVVYKAEDTKLGRFVVSKELRASHRWPKIAKMINLPVEA